MLPGLSENGIPFFAFLFYCLRLFITDLFCSSDSIFWQGLFVIPILATLVVFFISKNYKILLFCFLGLLITQIPSLITYYKSIDFLFLFLFLTFIISSIGVIVVIKKEQSWNLRFYDYWKACKLLLRYFKQLWQSLLLNLLIKLNRFFIHFLLHSKFLAIFCKKLF